TLLATSFRHWPSKPKILNLFRLVAPGFAGRYGYIEENGECSVDIRFLPFADGEELHFLLLRKPYPSNPNFIPIFKLYLAENHHKNEKIQLRNNRLRRLRQVPPSLVRQTRKRKSSRHCRPPP